MDGHSHYGQWLYVQVEASDKWCPPGVCLEIMLFNIFTNHIGRGIEYTFNKFSDDTKISSAADMLDERNATQRNLTVMQGGPM